MNRKLQDIIRRHLSDNILLYSIIVFAFVFGLCMGALTVNNIGIDTKAEIKTYIQGFLNLSSKSAINEVHILKQSIKFNLYSTVALILSGVTFLGIILVPAYAVFRGFCIGFTVAFLTDSLGQKGFLLSIASILPQNLVYIPVVMVLCVCALNLSFNTIKIRRLGRYGNMPAQTAFFICCAVILFAALIGGSIIESYLTPSFIKMVAASGIAN